MVGWMEMEGTEWKDGFFFIRFRADFSNGEIVKYSAKFLFFCHFERFK